jgi:hypothetical protein
MIAVNPRFPTVPSRSNVKRDSVASGVDYRLECTREPSGFDARLAVHPSVHKKSSLLPSASLNRLYH